MGRVRPHDAQGTTRLNAPAKLGRPNWMRVAKWSFQILVLALVAWGIWRMVHHSFDKMEAQQFSLWSLHPEWLVVSGLLYLVGSLPGWWFWHCVLVEMGQRPDKLASFRAYFIGHLGKYAPGKALVVVLRSALIRGPGVDVGVAATAVFVETLTLMAVGAVLSAVILAVRFHEQTQLLWAAVGMAVLAGIPALPPIFRRVLRVLRVAKASPSVDEGLGKLRWPLMATGWVIQGAGWWVMGLSLWAALMSLPHPPPALLDVKFCLPVLTLTVALALVAGFVSMIPAGAGVREAVVIAILVPLYGDLAAIVAAILLRLVWLVAEFAVTLVLYPLGRRRSSGSTETLVPATPEATSPNGAGGALGSESPEDSAAAMSLATAERTGSDLASGAASAASAATTGGPGAAHD